MVEPPKVTPLCEMGLGVQILGFKLQENVECSGGPAYCWNCLCLPNTTQEIRHHLNMVDLPGPSGFYASLQTKPRPNVPN